MKRVRSRSNIECEGNGVDDRALLSRNKRQFVQDIGNHHNNDFNYDNNRSINIYKNRGSFPIASSNGKDYTDEPLPPPSTPRTILLPNNWNMLIHVFRFIDQDELLQVVALTCKTFYQLIYSSNLWNSRTFTIASKKKFDTSAIASQRQFCFQLVQQKRIQFGGIHCSNSMNPKQLCEILIANREWLGTCLKNISIESSSINAITFQQLSSLMLFPSLENLTVNCIVEFDPKGRSFDACMSDWNHIDSVSIKELVFKPTFWKMDKSQISLFLTVSFAKLSALQALHFDITCIQNSTQFIHIHVGDLLHNCIRQVHRLGLSLPRSVTYSWQLGNDVGKVRTITIRSDSAAQLLAVCQSQIIRNCTSFTLEQPPRDLTNSVFCELCKFWKNVHSLQFSRCSYSFSSQWLYFLKEHVTKLNCLHFKLTSWLGASSNWECETTNVKSVKVLSFHSCHYIPSITILCRLFPSLEKLTIDLVNIPLKVSC
jgi:hypothetical protein